MKEVKTERMHQDFREWTTATGVERNYNHCLQNRLKRSHFN